VYRRGMDLVYFKLQRDRTLDKRGIYKHLFRLSLTRCPNHSHLHGENLAFRIVQEVSRLTNKQEIDAFTHYIASDHGDFRFYLTFQRPPDCIKFCQILHQLLHFLLHGFYYFPRKWRSNSILTTSPHRNRGRSSRVRVPYD